MSDLETARRIALSLPEATEQPHFEMSSFRARGKIYATVPPDGHHLHVFVDDQDAAAAVAENPAAFEPLHWGQRLRGLRIVLAASTPRQLQELIEESWRRKAPRRLVAGLDAERGS